METQNNKPKVIGIILAYKHAKYLEELYKSLPKEAFDEIIISNDETGDGIEKIAERLGIKCFSHPRGHYGGNMKYGLNKAMELGGDIMVEIHGDGQYGTSAIIPGIAKMKEGYDFVMGSRFINTFEPLVKYKMPLIRFMANVGLSFIDRLVFRIPISEFHSGSRFYSRKQLESIPLHLTANDHLFSFQLISLTIFHRLRVAEVPVICDYRKEHSSIKMSWAVKYAFQTMGVLVQYILAKLGFKTTLFIN
ncbi:MAG: glycosyltransferase family 2 protein [Patescibacteria group bacterium]